MDMDRKPTRADKDKPAEKADEEAEPPEKRARVNAMVAADPVAYKFMCERESAYLFMQGTSEGRYAVEEILADEFHLSKEARLNAWLQGFMWGWEQEIDKAPEEPKNEAKSSTD